MLASELGYDLIDAEAVSRSDTTTGYLNSFVHDFKCVGTESILWDLQDGCEYGYTTTGDDVYNNNVGVTCTFREVATTCELCDAGKTQKVSIRG